MILDMNINLLGIDDEFLEELDELIEETRVEYFIINPKTKEELQKTQTLCKEFERFKYVIPFFLKENKDNNCVAIQILSIDELDSTDEMPVVIYSENLSEEFIEKLNKSSIKGVILASKQQDIKLENFAFSISKESLESWEQKVIKDLDYNKIALQSDYPNQTYDEFLDIMLKKISDMTFRAEQTIAAGGTRTVLKTFWNVIVL